MRTNYIINAAVIFVVSVLFSCKKSDPAPSSGLAKVKTYIEDATNSPLHISDTFNVSYDANDRIQSLISTFSGGKFLYSYNGSSYTLDIMNANHLIIRETSFINSNSLVDSTFQYNDTNDSSTLRLIYNSNKQVIQQRWYEYSLISGAQLWKKEDFTYDANGNLIKNITTNPAGTTTIIITYTYNNVVPNLYLLGPVYRPVMYKNLPVSITYFYPGTGTTQSVAIAYVLDNNNRVVTETHTDNNGYTVIKKYSYY